MRDAFDEGYEDTQKSLANFEQMRLELEISEEENKTAIAELGTKYPELFILYWIMRVSSDSDRSHRHFF